MPATATSKRAAAKKAALEKAREGGKKAALAAFLYQQEKDHDEDPARLLDDTALRVHLRTVSTGAIDLDAKIGRGGGIPFGRITEIYGPEGGGKTTLALTAARNCQKQGGIVGFVDAENGLNRDLCRAIGIDPKKFVVVQVGSASNPGTGEDIIDRVDEMLESDAFDMIIVDSVAAMVPKAELEADIDQAFMGLLARLMSKFMRKVVGKVNQKDVALILLNQVRTNLSKYGNPDESTGGKAIKFYASLRIEIRSNIGGKAIKDGAKIIGQEVQAKIVKNRLGAPGGVAEYEVIFGRGINGAGSLLKVSEDLGVVTRAGASYTEVATGERIGVSKDAVRAILSDPKNKDLTDRLTAAVYATLRGETATEAEEMDDEEARLAAEAAAEAAAVDAGNPIAAELPETDDVTDVTEAGATGDDILGITVPAAASLAAADPFTLGGDEEDPAGAPAARPVAEPLIPVS